MSRRVLYLQYTNPAAYPPLEHSSRILADRGMEVLFLGCRDTAKDPLQFPEHPNIFVKEMDFQPPGWRQKVHYLYFCLWVLAWAMRWRTGLVYVSGELACPIALVLTYLPRLKAIYHEHDSPNFRPSEGSLFIRVALWARLRLARRALFCILPNEKRIDSFVEQTGARGKVVCIWNCPGREEVAPPRLPLADELRILFHGSIVPSRLPLTVVQALALLPPCTNLYVVGYETVGHPNYVQQLLEKARQCGVAERVHIIGAIPTRHELLDWCRKCDVGLALMPKQSNDINMQFMTGASNKPFDYLASGLALIVSDLPDWREMFVDSGHGLSCDPENPESIAAAIRALLSNPVEMRQMGERGRQRILEAWNYNAQFAKVLDDVSGTVTS